MAAALMASPASGLTAGRAAAPAGARPAPRSVAKVAAPRRARLAVLAAAQTSDKPAVAQFADSIGLPTKEGLFGFRPFAEVWVGRLAMMGFVVSIVEEAMTGQGTLRQIGLEPSPQLFAGLAGATGLALLAGTGATVKRLVSRQMTPSDVARYKNFLGLDKEGDSAAAAAEMKRRGDFTSLASDGTAIDAARGAMPADAVLGFGDVAAADATAKEMKAADGGVLTLTKAEEAAQVAAAAAAAKSPAPAAGPSVSLAAKPDILEQDVFKGSEAQYARRIEIEQGRWAMLGFLAAVLVEAGTGKGIILQVIMYLKLSGLLGAASGF